MHTELQETIARAVHTAFQDLSISQVNELVMDPYLQIREAMQGQGLAA